MIPWDSFLIDPILLIIVGSLIVLVTVRVLYRKTNYRHWIGVLGFITLIVFWATSISLYFNLAWPSWIWKMMGAKSGFEFMWNSAVFHLNVLKPSDLSWGWHLFAAIMWILYPIWLKLGIELGYMLYGRTEKQTGAIGLL